MTLLVDELTQFVDEMVVDDTGNPKIHVRQMMEDPFSGTLCPTKIKRPYVFQKRGGQDLANKIPHSTQQPKQYIKRTFRDSFSFRAILVHEVYDLLYGLDLKVSSIGVPRRCIKLASSHISDSLTTILNQSLQQGVVPDILKISKITPVDKGGEITDPFNFRPISTLSTFTQVLEKLDYQQIINYVEKQNILYECQLHWL
ncbi:predicted protein [Nematostella vectensis]|uniref:Uncharacterized protein n=1 Tax=Nematostella vectensis TaxID=45351 RepID=A7SQH7_NEMVE|nr:predicted protein [Nematostella vectensis]|eukprot:XP_001626138.1 predicted protein [Nematostella vectensis]